MIEPYNKKFVKNTLNRKMFKFMTCRTVNRSLYLIGFIEYHWLTMATKKTKITLKKNLWQMG